jgi:hypothetical protein
MMKNPTPIFPYLHTIAIQASDYFVCFFLPCSLYLMRISDPTPLSGLDIGRWLCLNSMAYGIVYTLIFSLGRVMPYLIGEEMSLAGGQASHNQTPAAKCPPLLLAPSFLLFPFLTFGSLSWAAIFPQPPLQSRGQPTQMIRPLKSARPFLLFQVAPLRIP